MKVAKVIFRSLWDDIRSYGLPVLVVAAAIFVFVEGFILKSNAENIIAKIVCIACFSTGFFYVFAKIVRGIAKKIRQIKKRAEYETAAEQKGKTVSVQKKNRKPVTLADSFYEK